MAYYIHSVKKLKFKKREWFSLINIYLVFHNSHNKEVKINLAYLQAFLYSAFLIKLRLI